MKKMTIMLLLPALIFVGCNQEKHKGNTEVLMTDTLRIPQKKYLSEKQLQDQVNKEIREILALANDERIADALQIIGTTESAVQHIIDSSYSDAIASLEEAIGKAAVMTTARPDLSFFPLDVEITTHDLVTDMEVLKQVRKDARHLTDKGYLQAARHLIKDLASELEITTPMLPVATYPDALSLAAKALNDKETEEALFILNTALNTLFIETRYVPLPLIRAERMIEEVLALLEEKDKDRDIQTLLENADYQIRFAEALGYGKRDKEFEELYSAIQEIRKELKKQGDGDSVDMTKQLREKLRLFKKRISESRQDNEEIP